MIFCNLGSGSRGNSTYIQADKGAILIDQGFSQKNLIHRMSFVDLSPEDITSIVLTHEHTDHSCGAANFAKRYGIPIYTTKKTLESLPPKVLHNSKVNLFSSGDTLVLENIELKTFHIPHDASDPIGLVATSGGIRLGIITDLGMVTQSILYHLSDLDLLFLESNHDRFMLLNGPYPLFLIQRIRSRVGHLSNNQALNLFKQLPCNGRLKYLYIGHVSGKNNDPQTVREIFEKAINENFLSCQLEIASQDEPGKVIEL